MEKWRNESELQIVISNSVERLGRYSILKRRKNLEEIMSLMRKIN
jgi:hypothetical protein